MYHYVYQSAYPSARPRPETASRPSNAAAATTPTPTVTFTDNKGFPVFKMLMHSAPFSSLAEYFNTDLPRTAHLCTQDDSSHTTEYARYKTMFTTKSDSFTFFSTVTESAVSYLTQNADEIISFTTFDTHTPAGIYARIRTEENPDPCDTTHEAAKSAHTEQPLRPNAPLNLQRVQTVIDVPPTTTLDTTDSPAVSKTHALAAIDKYLSNPTLTEDELDTFIDQFNLMLDLDTYKESVPRRLENNLDLVAAIDFTSDIFHSNELRFQYCIEPSAHTTSPSPSDSTICKRLHCPDKTKHMTIPLVHDCTQTSDLDDDSTDEESGDSDSDSELDDPRLSLSPPESPTLKKSPQRTPTSDTRTRSDDPATQIDSPRPIPEFHLACEFCDSPFTTVKPYHRYCSQSCYDKHTSSSAPQAKLPSSTTSTFSHREPSPTGTTASASTARRSGYQQTRRVHRPSDKCIDCVARTSRRSKLSRSERKKANADDLKRSAEHRDLKFVD